MIQFAVLFPNGKAINNSTVIKSTGKTIQSEKELKDLIYKHWCKFSDSTSFQGFADDLNEEYADELDGSTYTAEDGLDNLASNYTINIVGAHVDMYEYMKEYLNK